MLKNVLRHAGGLCNSRRRSQSVSLVGGKSDERPMRRHILELLRRGTVGAELGVFTGLFSAAILEVVQPTHLYLVDPWWVEYGEYYPDWGTYTDGGRLRTRDAYQQAVNRVRSVQKLTKVEFCVQRSTTWLNTLEDERLDWAYLDSTHQYNDTMQELELLGRKVKRSGLILGDDWQPDSTHMHHGVFKAVQDFSRKGSFEIIRADEHLQWALRRTD
jgi:hypothetical protein